MHTNKTEFSHPAIECLEDYELEEHGIELPIIVSTRKIVCPGCGGYGTHDRKDIDTSRLVDMMEEDGDYEGLDHYYSGGYDQRCGTCNGSNVVDDIDWDTVPEAVARLVDEWNQDARTYAMECAAERRAGA